MKRLIALTAATATALTLALAASPAQAASKPGVLSAKEIKAAYGVKVSGRAITVGGVRVPKTCTKNVVLRIKKGKEANYRAGYTFAVTSGAYVAKSPSSAKKLVSKIQKQITCMASGSVKISKAKMPALGNQRVAYEGKIVAGNTTVGTMNFFIVRKQATVVLLGVTSENAPQHAANKRMIKKAVKIA